MTTVAEELYQDVTGEPIDVLKLRTTELSEPSEDEIMVDMLAAPINPSDVNTVQGKYPINPELPGGITGHEGVGRVASVGKSGGALAVGDLVVPISGNEGTWRSSGIFKAANWHKLPYSIPVADAATILVNPGTALLMLEQFHELKPGDCVVQNGATSAVGRFIIAFCKQKGVKNIAVIRDRPNWDETVEDLTSAGADLVVTSENLRESFRASGLPPPKLALNCVCGEVATTMAKLLEVSGTLVTYGAMAMQPVTIPAPLLIFKDIRVRGFWISASSKKEGLEGRAQLVDRLAKLVHEGVISTKAQDFALKDWQSAFAAAQASGPKVLFRFDQ